VDTRRFALEAYLRLLVRLPLVLERSQCMKNFLNLKKIQSDFAVEEFVYQQNKMQFIKFYEVDDGEFVENNIYHTESNEDDEDEEPEEEAERKSFSAVHNVDGSKDAVRRESLVKRLEALISEADLLSPGPGGDPDGAEEYSDDEGRNSSTERSRSRSKSAGVAAAFLEPAANSNENSHGSGDPSISQELSAAIRKIVPAASPSGSNGSTPNESTPRRDADATKATYDKLFADMEVRDSNELNLSPRDGANQSSSSSKPSPIPNKGNVARVVRVKVDDGDPLASLGPLAEEE
jgi:hypothetical protein